MTGNTRIATTPEIIDLREVNPMHNPVYPVSDGDTICIERLPGGGQRIFRQSGRPIGELIPIGVDPSLGLLELITVEGELLPLSVIPTLQAATSESTNQEDSHD